MVSQLHGPFIQYLCDKMDYEDSTLVHRLQVGFDYLGDIEPGHVGSDEFVDGSWRPSPQGLWEQREDTNRTILASLHHSEHEDGVMDETIADAQEGFMTLPQEVTGHNTADVVLSPRLPVREWREKDGKEYERTRVTDDESKSSVNFATRMQEKLRCETLDTMTYMLTFMLACGRFPLMWKQDVRKAFRACPIFWRHLPFAHVCFLWQGKRYMSGHRSMPFGTISAVAAWHRLGAFACEVCRRLARCPAGRYVDDYYGVCWERIQVTGDIMLAVLMSLVGTSVDPGKGARRMLDMILLGAQLLLDRCRASFSVKVAEAKARKWACQLRQHLQTGLMSAGQASKAAGKLSFSLTITANRCGRAFIKYFHMQQHAPLPGGCMSAGLSSAALWFVAFLESQVHRWRQGNDRLRERRRVVFYTDAAGSTRWLAAVVHCNGTWYWTRIRTPQAVWDQLLERGDNQIGLQELLAAVLAIWTFHELITDSLTIHYIDNAGVVHGMLKGRLSSADGNLIVSRVWLALARWNVAWAGFQVESDANCADLPTRDDLSMIEEQDAVYVSPVLPSWLADLWQVPEWDAFTVSEAL